MREYIEIFEDVIRIATFQPRQNLRDLARSRQPSRSRTRGMTFVP